MEFKEGDLVTTIQIQDCKGYLDRELHTKTLYILRKCDIKCGYYYASGRGFNLMVDLSKCALANRSFYLVNSNLFNQSLRGKLSQPISLSKFQRMTLDNFNSKSVTTFVLFKGEVRRVKATFYDNMLYWIDSDYTCYKTKAWRNKQGCLVGIGVHNLSPRKKNCYTEE